MAPPGEAPKLSKRRKLGKGKKKAWKVAKVDDIVDFLDEERRQIEAGGVVSEKKDEKLFFVDKAKAAKAVSSGKRISKEERRNRPLKSTALLTPNNNVKSPIAPLHENHKKGRKYQKLLQVTLERAASKTKLLALEQRKKFLEEKRAATKLKRDIPSETIDLWNDDEIKEARVKPPKGFYNKPSKLEATYIPHPGTSVNPSYEDHQGILEAAMFVENKKINSALHSAKVMKTDEEKATPATHLEEMTSGLMDETESESEEEKLENSEITPSISMQSRKSKKQRRHEKELKEQMRNKKAKAEEGRQLENILRIKVLKKEIRKKDEIIKKRKEAKQKVIEQKPYTTKRLGKIKFEEPLIDFKLSNELVPSLRQMKPEGDVLTDIYKNMMRRNLLEPRAGRHNNKSKYKKKSFIKNTHKVFN